MRKFDELLKALGIIDASAEKKLRYISAMINHVEAMPYNMSYFLDLMVTKAKKGSVNAEQFEEFVQKWEFADDE